MAEDGRLLGRTPSPNDNPHWTNAVLARAAAMQERDKNHLAFDLVLGNESFGGSNIYAMSQNSSGNGIPPDWYTMRALSTTADSTKPATWKARCIHR